MEVLHTSRVKSLFAVIILLDLSAAFNITTHQILLSTFARAELLRFCSPDTHAGPVLPSTSLPISIHIYSQIIHLHSFSYHSSADTPCYSSPPPFLICLADASEWILSHHQKLNPYTNELVFHQGKGCLCQDMSITTNDSVVMPAQSVRNLQQVLVSSKNDR